MPARFRPRGEIEPGNPDPVVIDQDRRGAGRPRHTAPLAAHESLPISVETSRSCLMFTGLKRSILIIVASVTVLPWGVMQLVQ